MRTRCDDLKLEAEPLNHLGSLEPAIRAMRDHRPLDLNAEIWRAAHPGGAFADWRAAARACLRGSMTYDPGPLDLRPEVLKREERDGLIRELVAFNTAPWFRVKGWFLRPIGSRGRLPGLVVFHEWGGPILFGKERVTDSGRDSFVLADHRARAAGGRYLADEFARAGYAVIVIDAFYFGERGPRGFNGIPAEFDPFEMSSFDCWGTHQRVVEQLYVTLRGLIWAGVTWMGILFADDVRCLDYLQSRPEVDPERLGCTGLSVGAWRTNVLGALDARGKAAVSACWMTTGDYQHLHNLAGAIGGPFALLPGVWDRLDVPDLPIMSAPCASMVISGAKDIMFPVEGQQEAARQIRAGYEWAGCPARFKHVNPPKPHCYDVELQKEAIAWFDRHLKPGSGAQRGQAASLG